MSSSHGIILGIVQGIAEFLPISSTGHLILIREALTLSTSHALAFDAVLQLATVLAVIVYFHRDLFRLTQTALRMLARLQVDEKEGTMLWAVLLGTIPALIAGIFLEDIMETVFRAPLLVAFVLVAGSVLFAYAEFIHYRRGERSVEMTQTRGIIIGCFQALALVPGMSRSGATISGGLILGISRYDATRFSFILAIPILLGSGLKKLLELISYGNSAELWVLAVGAGTAFFVGLCAIHFMLLFLRNHTLWPFIWYRIGLAIVVILFVFSK